MAILKSSLVVFATATMLSTFAFAQHAKQAGPSSLAKGSNTPAAVLARAARSNVSSPTTSASTVTTDVYRVQYFRNANTTNPDQEVDIVDPGTNWPIFNSLAAEPDICADVYVVDPAEELQECCGCLLTPDQLIATTVNALTSNALIGPPFVNNGVIKIISAAPSNGACDPRFPVPTPTLREWITHTTSEPGLVGVLATEEEFSAVTLSAGELGFLEAGCQYVGRQGSTHGICDCNALDLPESSSAPGATPYYVQEP